MSELKAKIERASEENIENAAKCCLSCESAARTDHVRVAVQHGAKIGYRLAIAELRERAKLLSPTGKIRLESDCQCLEALLADRKGGGNG